MWLPASTRHLPTSSDLEHANAALNEAEKRRHSALSHLKRVQADLMDTEKCLGDLWYISAMIQDKRVVDDCSFVASMTEEETKRRKDLAFPLAMAHLQVDSLSNYLLELRGWIAPIRMLDADVLALIFEFSGENDWRTTLRIAAVSRFWRRVALDTPRMWSYIDTRNHSCRSAIEAFLERSGGAPLHIHLPKAVPSALLSHCTGRIKCLSIDDSHSDFMPPFSKLKWLSIRGYPWSFFIKSHFFPVLSHLVYDPPLLAPSNRMHDTPLLASSHLAYNVSTIYRTPIDIRMPPLETLALQACAEWYHIVKSCRHSLVSLKVGGYTDTASRFKKIRLPTLKCLEIERLEERSGPLDLIFITPVLETYVEALGGYSRLRGVSGIMETVKYIRVDKIPYISEFPNLRVIQFTGDLNIDDFIGPLLKDDTLYSHLERIELEPGSEGNSPKCPLGLLKVGSRVVEVSVISGMRETPLPGMISTTMASLW